MPQIPRLKFKAILLGVFTDTIGTLVVATGLLFAMAAAGIPANEIVTRMHGLSGLLLMLIVGLGFTLIGAYVSGRSAGQSEICTELSLREQVWFWVFFSGKPACRSGMK